MKQDTKEYIAIQDEESGITLLDGQPCKHTKSETQCLGRERWRFFNVNGILVVINVIALGVNLLWLRQNIRNSPRGIIYSPARDVAPWNAVTFNTSIFSHNKYNGEPRNESTEAWQALIQHDAVLFTAEELRKLNRTSVKIREDGYLATLGFGHQLHCLNYLRQYIYSDFYPNKEDPHTTRIHISHCIDNLRQSIQCQGDISVLTYSWRPDYRFPWPDFQIQHQCRDWEALIAWTDARKTKPGEVHAVQNPILKSDYNGSTPSAFEGSTELVGGTRTNPKVLAEAGDGSESLGKWNDR